MFDRSNNKTHKVKVRNIFIGGNTPVLVQSMTNTDTADAYATYKQIKELFLAGSELVRITVNNDEAARAVPKIREFLEKDNLDVPLSGCFHYNGHRLLTDYPECAEALDKYRINPGNVGFGKKRDSQFEMMIECALKHNKPIRVGVNWGSLDQELTTKLMDDNAKLLNPLPAEEVMREALVISTLISAQKAEEIGLRADQIIISAKVSRVQELVSVYRELAKRSNYALHLGLTEAGMGIKGIAATAASFGILLQEGIGDTIRCSITPRPGEARTKEVEICREILQTMGFRSFSPQISSCPGCGRTSSTYFQELAEKVQNHINEQMLVWKDQYPGVETLNIAVMGCIVNGPGESKHADIGISLPGTGESPVAPVFIDGKKAHTLRGNNIAEEFKNILNEYIQNRFAIKVCA